MNIYDVRVTLCGRVIAANEQEAETVAWALNWSDLDVSDDAEVEHERALPWHDDLNLTMERNKQVVLAPQGSFVLEPCQDADEIADLIEKACKEADKYEPEEQYNWRCQDCGKGYHEEHAAPIPHLYDRVSPGEPLPLCECDECGALVVKA